MQAATGAYRSDMDVLGDFLGDGCEFSPQADISSAELNRAYSERCEQNGERPMSARSLGMRLKERGFTAEKIGNANKRTWRGLTLRAHASA